MQQLRQTQRRFQILTPSCTCWACRSVYAYWSSSSIERRALRVLAPTQSEKSRFCRCCIWFRTKCGQHSSARQQTAWSCLSMTRTSTVYLINRRLPTNLSLLRSQAQTVRRSLQVLWKASFVRAKWTAR